MTTTTPDTGLVRLPLADLHASPTNPRKRYDDVSLAELAADIKAHGRVLQPLLVRPRVPELFAGTNDPLAQVGYEVVFGHRRRRGAELAGLTEVDCMVRDMTDAEVARAQISENLQRTDVHAIEEAEGFQALIDNHGETADSIAAMTGKSRTYVYARLKLLEACPKIRAACLEGKVGVEVALLIARLRVNSLQEKALAFIEGKYLRIDDGGAKSFREIRSLLAEKFTLGLAGAPFSRDDATLLPAAGTCEACTKRTGNAPEYADLVDDSEGYYPGHKVRGSADICTDPICFDQKKAAQFKRQADTMRAAGETVIVGTAARNAIDANGKVKGAYISAADLKAEIKKHKLTVVTLQDPRDGKTIKAVKAADAAKVGAKPAPAPASQNDAWRKQQAEREQQAQAETDRRTTRMLSLVAQLQSMAPPAGAVRVIANALISTSGREQMQALHKALCKSLALPEVESHEERVEQVKALIERSTDAECLTICLATLMADELDVYWHGIKDPAVVIDAVAGLVETASPTPSTAARAAKGAPDMVKGVKYRHAATGQTWTGRGLKPRWLVEALANGATLDSFALDTPSTAAPAADGAALVPAWPFPLGAAPREQMVDAADAASGATAGRAGQADEPCGGQSEQMVEAADAAAAGVAQ